MVITILAVVIGLLMCFFGYKLFRVWLAVAGLILGALLGHYLGGLIGGGSWPIIGAIVIGVLLAILAYALYKLGAILVGALLAAMLLVTTLSVFGMEPIWWAALIGAIIGGIVAGIFIKEFIIIGSSFQGSYMVIGGLYALIANTNYLETRNQDLLSFPWYVLLAILVLTVVAAAAQMKYAKDDNSDLARKKK
ncbi:hypothetical protein SDC9_89197 [bioreactor metagenome]|uniref:TM7S3/TM198-like domain-containing protein n=1 Tax=bioreactor metagenome TaxID=1076179 RepID=A0A644ZRL7_9ZZZZ|nr:DUF4203 domain-containing protein [Candidatus Pelethousia sp.]